MKLELKKLSERIDELKNLLIKMEEDLLLEIGNVYIPKDQFKPRKDYEIIEVDENYVTFSHSAITIASLHAKMQKNELLKKIRNKELLPDKVTSRKIKLKRLLYVS